VWEGVEDRLWLEIMLAESGKDDILPTCDCVLERTGLKGDVTLPEASV
jgi:hypothetical protein